MEQNFNEQNTYAQNPAPQQEQVPFTEPAPQQPVYQQPVYQQPYQQNPYGYQQPYQAPVYPQPMYPYPTQPRPENVPGLKALADSAFSKGLAAAIMGPWPVTSIIAIIMGSMAKKKVKEADNLAAQHGTKAPGKRTAAKVLGNVGFGVGIGMTIFWAFYIILIIAIVLSATTSSYYYYY